MLVIPLVVLWSSTSAFEIDGFCASCRRVSLVPSPRRMDTRLRSKTVPVSSDHKHYGEDPTNDWILANHHHPIDKNDHTSDRRRLLRDASLTLAASLCTSNGIRSDAVYADDTTATIISSVPIVASWSATSGLNITSSNNNNNARVRFDPSAYAAMRDDVTRTPLFEKAIQRRIQRLQQQQQQSITVIDVGTGPFALFAVVAARAGATRVYALESDPAVAAQAREAVRSLGFADVIRVVEGPSTSFSILEKEDKADLLVAEVVGSVATEEGAYATVLDAGRRLLRRPDDPGAYVPARIRTYAAPASYTLHNLFKPPSFDWTKLDGEPVRFDCRDLGLQLLSDPQCVEDVDFCREVVQSMMSDDDQTSSTSDANTDTTILRRRRLSFTVDPQRVQDNQAVFFQELVKNGVLQKEAGLLSVKCAQSVSGLALWPRIVVAATTDEEEDTWTISTRSFPRGAHTRSHWQTVLPIMAPVPVGPLRGGETIVVDATVELPTSVDRLPKYKLEGTVNGMSS